SDYSIDCLHCDFLWRMVFGWFLVMDAREDSMPKGTFQIACGTAMGIFIVLGVCGGMVVGAGLFVRYAFQEADRVHAEIGAENKRREEAGLPKMNREEENAFFQKSISGN